MAAIEPSEGRLPSDKFLADLLDAVSQPMIARGVSVDEIYEIRRKLYAAITRPNQQTWTEASEILLHDAWRGRTLTLWRGCLEFTSYEIGVRDYTEPWSELPSPAQILCVLAQLAPASSDQSADFDF